MKNFYEVGKVYIWQNRTGGFAFLNGQETTIIAEAIEGTDQNGRKALRHETDTPNTIFPTNHKHFFACKGSLRPKNPPSGEKTIHEIISGKLNININEEETV